LQELGILASVFFTTDCGSQTGIGRPTLAPVAVALERSVTIEAMGSDSESSGGERKPAADRLGPASTLVAPAPIKPSVTTELHATPLRPGAAARRLLADEERKAKEFLHHLPATFGVMQRLRRHGWSTLRYLMQTEVHTYAFSVAANYLLSTFPFFVLLLTLTRRVFRSPAMYDVVLQVLRDYLPSNKDFVIRNMQFLANVFLPLEVALNGIWGFKKNRSYLMNLLVGTGLGLACGSVSVLTVAATVEDLKILGLAIDNQSIVFRGLAFIVMKIFAVLAVISVFFLIYWLLPNGKVPVRAVLPAAIMTGLLVEAAKYIYMLALPWLDFPEAYGPFSVSVTLLVWGFWIGLLLLGGAYFSAAEHSDRVLARRETAAAES